MSQIDKSLTSVYTKRNALWQPLLGLQQIKINLHRDCTLVTSQASNLWQRTLPSVASAEVDCRGLVTDTEILKFFLTMITSGVSQELQFYPISAQAWRGTFFCAQIEITKQYQGEQEFRLLFKSTSEVTTSSETADLTEKVAP